MNDLDFTFEQTPWEAAFAALRPGDTLSAARFLALTEGEEEDAVEEALDALTERHILLDASGLPKDDGAGTLGQRLKLEEKLAAEGRLFGGFPEDDPLEMYLREIAGTPAAGEPGIWASQVAAGNMSAANMLLNVSMHQVIGEAQKMTGRGVLLLDLMQEASLGLWQCILEWKGGEDFAVHSLYAVRQALARAVTMQARQSGVGRKLRELMESYRGADRKLLGELGRNPTVEEISAELGIDPESGYTARDMVRSADLAAQAKKAAQPPEETSEDAQAVEDTADWGARQRILDMLSALESLDAQILTLRFGLEGGLPLTPAESGRKLNITAEEVSRRETAALAKLRENG